MSSLFDGLAARNATDGEGHARPLSAWQLADADAALAWLAAHPPITAD